MPPVDSDPPHFPISLSHFGLKDTVDEVKKIILHLRPDWHETFDDDDVLDYEIFTLGKTNAILSVWNKKLGGKNDRVLVRIYGEKTDRIIDRHAEKRNMAFLHRHDCAPPLYGTFDNGIIYGYVPGHVPPLEKIRESHLAELIAKQMAKMHAIDYDQHEDCQATEIQKHPVLFSGLASYIENLPTHFDEPNRQEKYATHFPSKQELLAELQSIREKVESLHSPVVFCHNDLSGNNVVYDEARDQIHFIDYEYCGYNYQGFDIGNHFREFAGDAMSPEFWALYPSEQCQKTWLRNYLQYFREFTKQPLPTDQDVHRLYVQVNTFATISHFWWALWELIQARYSTLDFDFLPHGIDRMNRYKQIKERVWNWTMDA